jgi:hypothetical protein
MMDLLENLKAELTQTIQLTIQTEIQKKFKNCEYSIFERRIWLLETQVHNFTELIYAEIQELRTERADLFELKSKIKDAQLFLENEINQLKTRIDQEKI